MCVCDKDQWMSPDSVILWRYCESIHMFSLLLHAREPRINLAVHRQYPATDCQHSKEITCDRSVVL